MNCKKSLISSPFGSLWSFETTKGTQRTKGNLTTDSAVEQTMSEPYLAIQVVMMPRDVNPHGTIFGGVILSYIDQAGAIGARREVVLAGGKQPRLVTVAINRVEFSQPVEVGDVVRFLTHKVK